MTFSHVIIYVYLFYSFINSSINQLSSTLFFILDGIPPDGTPISVTNAIHTAVIVIFDIIAALGIIFAICCLVFNIAFRNKKLVTYSLLNLANQHLDKYLLCRGVLL